MLLKKIVALNIKYYRFQQDISQKKLCKLLDDMDISYLSAIECGSVNLTCSTIEHIAEKLNMENYKLFDIETANLAKDFPNSLTEYRKEHKK